MKKEKTVARKLKIMAGGMSLIALSLIIFTLPVSLAGAPASMDNDTPMIQAPVGVGSISITTEPSGADVYLDGVYEGMTPVTLADVLIGTHGIELRKEGYVSNFVNIAVKPDETVVVVRVLSPILTGNISAISEPSEADVYLDDVVYVGTTPVVFNASAGLQDILFVKEGYESYSTYISVKPGETVEVKAVLSSTLPGNISASSEPSGAMVYLDHEYVGTTPVEFNASAGYHSIYFEKEGYYSDYHTISVIPGETVKVEGELMWMGADVILGVVIILIPFIILILFFYYLYRRSKKNKEYRLEQEKKIERFNTHISIIEIELKRIAEFIDAQLRENPYVAGGAVDDPRFWLGNENLINRVLTSISRNHFFIRGGRRSGKTTLLMRISRALEMKTDPEVRFIPVYVSLQGIPPEMFFKRLYKAIVNKVNMSEVNMSDIEEPDKIGDAEDFINAMTYIIESINNASSTKSVIVLLLDEIELFNSYPLDLRESFRTVFMGPPEFSEHIRLIATGTEIEVWTRSSPMNYLIEIEIEPLTAEEAREMILRPAKGVASFDDAAVDKIIERAHGRPFKIQKICEQLIDTAIQKRVYRIKAEDVDELINSPKFKEGSK